MVPGPCACESTDVLLRLLRRAASRQDLVEIPLGFSKARADGERLAEVFGGLAPPALLGEREPQVVVASASPGLTLKASR